jgi:hypothetical protein
VGARGAARQAMAEEGDPTFRITRIYTKDAQPAPTSTSTAPAASDGPRARGAARADAPVLRGSLVVEPEPPAAQRKELVPSLVQPMD